MTCWWSGAKITVFDIVRGLYCNLRRPNLEDKATLVRWMKDPYLNSTVFDDQSFVGGASRQATHWIKENTKVYGAESLLALAYTVKGKHPIGFVLLTNIDWKSRNADLRYLVGDAKYRQSLFGPEIALLSLQLAFHVLNLHKTYAYVLSGNKDSLGLAAFGGREEGILKHYVPTQDGWNDYHLYCMFDSDFQTFLKDHRDGVLRRHYSAGLLGP